MGVVLCSWEGVDVMSKRGLTLLSWGSNTLFLMFRKTMSDKDSEDGGHCSSSLREQLVKAKEELQDLLQGPGGVFLQESAFLETLTKALTTAGVLTDQVSMGGWCGMTEG